MKITNLKKQGLALAGTVAIALVSLPASALDLGGFTTPTDALCALDPACALPRGGVSDVMTVYNPNGSVLDRIFAFGNEEVGNIYYFDPAVVPIDPAQAGNFVFVTEENNGTVLSDVMGLFAGQVLAFSSDGETPLGSANPGPNDHVFTEIPGSWIWVSEPGSTATVQYDVTQYLSPDLQRLGYTASFQSDVPEPTTLALFSFGLAGLGFSRKRRAAA